MKNKGIVFFLIFLALVMVAVIIYDYKSERPGRSKANPFSLNIEAYKSVDSSLINYRETKNFKVGFEKPAAIKVVDDRIYIVGDNKLKTISLSGSLLSESVFDFIPKTMEVSGDKIYLAAENRVLVFDREGNETDEWQPLPENSYITALAVTNEYVFVADAGRRKIVRYDPDGNILNEFDGKANEGDLHGFIIPSPIFDIAIENGTDLWVVNPGLHSMENYTFEGRLRGHWKQSGVNIEGFSGCCNPGHFTFLNDGRFVTSEKGLVRIKTYHPSGELDGVVAAPVKFASEGHAPDVAADSRNNIYALDFDTKMIRVFAPR